MYLEFRMWLGVLFDWLFCVWGSFFMDIHTVEREAEEQATLWPQGWSPSFLFGLEESRLDKVSVREEISGLPGNKWSVNTGDKQWEARGGWRKEEEVWESLWESFAALPAASLSTVKIPTALAVALLSSPGPFWWVITLDPTSLKPLLSRRPILWNKWFRQS